MVLKFANIIYHAHKTKYYPQEYHLLYNSSSVVSSHHTLICKFIYVANVNNETKTQMEFPRIQK